MDVTPFLATFSGVVFAFLFARLWDRHQDDRRRIRLLELIERELDVCKQRTAGHLLPTDAWDAAVASGRAMLLDTDFLRKNELDTMALSQMYNKLRNYNYEAQGVNRFREAYWLSKGSADEQRLEAHWDERSQTFLAMHGQTMNDVDEVLKRIRQLKLDC